MDLSKFTSNGKFLMLALDHRGSFKKLMSAENPDSVTDEEVITLKNEIIECLKDQFSALLIDEIWGLSACHEICHEKPFLLPLEKSGYTDESGERITELEYSVQQIKEMGASGAKLLIYFNPDGETVQKQLETARKVIKECKQANFPLFLEIVTYNSVIPANAGIHLNTLLYRSRIKSGMTNAGDDNRVIESVKMFIDSGIIPSVWKLEYPGSLEACQELTDLVGQTPWILLTGGKSFEEFKPQLEEAINGGAKGFLAGRALWQEVCILEGDGKEKFLKETLPQRFEKVSEIAIKSHST